MTTMTINPVSMLSNPGQAKQQDLAFALTGEIRKPDAVRFDMDSDIPEFPYRLSLLVSPLQARLLCPPLLLKDSLTSFRSAFILKSLHM